MNKYDKYLKVTSWLWKRYSTNGVLVVYTNGKDTLYAKLEKLFFDKYLA